MAKKKETSEDLKLIKSKLLENKIVIGKDATVKKLKTDKLEKVYLASNCPDRNRQDVEQYAQLANVTVLTLELDNEELGVFCKKNYFISVLGITA